MLFARSRALDILAVFDWRIGADLRSSHRLQSRLDVPNEYTPAEHQPLAKGALRDRRNPDPYRGYQSRRRRLRPRPQSRFGRLHDDRDVIHGESASEHSMFE